MSCLSPYRPISGQTGRDEDLKISLSRHKLWNRWLKAPLSLTINPKHSLRAPHTDHSTQVLSSIPPFDGTSTPPLYILSPHYPPLTPDTTPPSPAPGEFLVSRTRAYHRIFERYPQAVVWEWRRSKVIPAAPFLGLD